MPDVLIKFPTAAVRTMLRARAQLGGIVNGLRNGAVRHLGGALQGGALPGMGKYRTAAGGWRPLRNGHPTAGLLATPLRSAGAGWAGGGCGWAIWRGCEHRPRRGRRIEIADPLKPEHQCFPG